MTLEVTYELADIRAAMRLLPGHWRRVALGALVICIPGAFVAYHWRESLSDSRKLFGAPFQFVCLIVLGISLTIILAYIYRSKAAQMLSKSSALARPKRFVIDQTSITMVELNGVAEYPWSSFNCLTESGQTFVLRLAQGPFMILPKRCFAGDAEIDEFRALAKMRIGLTPSSTTPQNPIAISKPNALFTAEYQLTLADMAEAYRRAVRIHLLYAILAFGIGVYVELVNVYFRLWPIAYSGPPETPPAFFYLWPVAFMAFGAWVFISAWRGGRKRRQWRRDPSLRQPHMARVDHEGIFIAQSLSQTLYPWHEIVRFGATRRLFLVFTASSGYLVLPKRGFSDPATAEEFGKFARRMTTGRRLGPAFQVVAVDSEKNK